MACHSRLDWSTIFSFKFRHLLSIVRANVTSEFALQVSRITMTLQADPEMCVVGLPSYYTVEGAYARPQQRNGPLAVAVCAAVCRCRVLI